MAPSDGGGDHDGNGDHDHDGMARCAFPSVGVPTPPSRVHSNASTLVSAALDKRLVMMFEIKNMEFKSPRYRQAKEASIWRGGQVLSG